MARIRLIRSMDAAGGLIRKREEFRTATRKTPYGDFVSMRGLNVRNARPTSFADVPLPDYSAGALPGDYYPSFKRATYAVYSYETPIAWYVEQPRDLTSDALEAWLSDDPERGHWVMPEVKYSRTTTQHQSGVRGALNGYAYGVYARNPDGTVNYSERPPALPVVELQISVAPEKVDCSVERTWY